MIISEFANYCFKRTWNSSFIYFTYWCLVLQFFFYIGVLEYYQESVVILVLTVSILGGILTYIYPKKITLSNIDIHIQNRELQIIDLFLHQFPLLLILVSYNPQIKPDNLVFAAVGLLVYVLIYNPLKIYNFKINGKHTKEDKLIKYNLLKNRTRYNVATIMVFTYLCLLIFAIKLGYFR
jgi:hypothetical protein